MFSVDTSFGQTFLWLKQFSGDFFLVEKVFGEKFGRTFFRPKHFLLKNIFGVFFLEQKHFLLIIEKV